MRGTRAGAQQILDAAGIDNAHLITSHAFRRTVATLLAREVEDKAAASMLGHADLTMKHAAYIDRLKWVLIITRWSCTEGPSLAALILSLHPT